MPFPPFDHQAWCGPASPLATRIVSFLKTGNGLTLADLEDGALHERIGHVAERWADPYLVDRWQGLRALGQFAVSRDNAYLPSAIAAFDRALAAESALRVKRPQGASALLDAADWTPGTLIVHDFLCEQLESARPAGIARAIASETTPILVASQMPGQRDFASVMNLIVEALPAETELVTPDFWSMGLVAFGQNETEDGKRIDFLSLMQDALRLTLNRPMRIRWRLTLRKGLFFPRVISGRSAEASAACAVWALTEQSERNPGPLLNKQVAITARLGPANGSTFPKRSLAVVSDKTLNAKLDVALDAGLTAVLVHEGQVAADRTAHRRMALNERELSVLIQRVATLGQAYESLLVTSDALKRYNAGIVSAWDRRWVDE